MPCSDSSSSISIKLTPDEHFVSFDFAKITCGREITAQTGYSQYCSGKSLSQILKIPYQQAVADLKLTSEESQFILYLEWDALRSSIAQYLGMDDVELDKDRCLITSVEYSDQGIELAEVILPPKEMPKILPCGMVDKKLREPSERD